MNYLKKYIYQLLITFGELILGCFPLAVLYYYNIISNKYISICLLITVLFIIFLNSFFLGKQSIKKGYFEGIKFGIGIILVFLITTIIFSKFHFRILLYYIMIILTSIGGSIIGINKKKSK